MIKFLMGLATLVIIAAIIVCILVLVAAFINVRPVFWIIMGIIILPYPVGYFIDYLIDKYIP